MSKACDFIIENSVLKKYVAPGGDVAIPEGVTSISSYAFSGCSRLFLYVKIDSYAETYAKENNIPFVAE